ncbi:hypothetical protein [Rhizobium sp. PL01]|uniref:hypothetical protein n=1 Tax=Rhizobium sp. PL01 TaxID=3085631 RepID=UPI002980B58C|nr:hypothetical protein [Rhizobium sp. PL01]MDW5314524.1 hypothetical protein [Rhizobium sp. PL01]
MTDVPFVEFPLISEDLSEEDTSAFLRKEGFAVSVGTEGLRIMSATASSRAAFLVLEDRSGILQGIVDLPAGDRPDGYVRYNRGLWNFAPGRTPGTMRRSGGGMVRVDKNVVRTVDSGKLIAVFGHDDPSDVQSSLLLLGLFDKKDVCRIVTGIWACPLDGEIFRSNGTCPVHGRRLVRKA